MALIPKKAEKKTLKNYTNESMMAALEDCDRGLAVSVSAKKHGVPRITLLYKINGKYPRNSVMGPKSYLNKEEEEILCDWIINTARAGFPVGKNQLLDSVQQLVKELKRPTPFLNNRPGKKWYYLFLKRNPQIALRTPQNLTNSRASVTQELLNAWFQEVFQYLQKSNHDDILSYPERVFNCDEAAFFLNPKGDRVLAKKGEKNVYQIINNDEKECVTVLVTGNAAGDMPPPMIIFKYERIPKDVAFSVPESWGIGKSDSGWMTGETFYEFIANIFHPWLLAKNVELPVILFVDGHTSHLTLHTSRFCDQNGIILVALYPNATHLIQPMDVAVFRTLKGGWRENTRRLRLERSKNPYVKKTDFSNLLKWTMDQRLHPDIIKNGFRKCGLCPWDPQAVQLKNDSAARENKETVGPGELRKFEEGLRFLENQIDSEKIKKFRENERWEGAVEDTSLFKLYKKTEEDVKKWRREIWGDILVNSEYDGQNAMDSENEENGVSVTKDKILESDSENLTKNCQKSSAITDPNIGQSEIWEANLENPEYDGQNENDLDDLKNDESRVLITQDKIFANNLQNSTQSDQQSSAIMDPINDQPSTSREKTPIKIISNILIPNLDQNPKEEKNIPSPFKRALTWPEPKPAKKKRAAKEKIPAVVTSKAWQEYYESKERKKREEEKKKIMRAEERQKKKEMQNKLKEEKKASKENKKGSKKNRSKKRIYKGSFTSDSETSDSWKSSGSSDEMAAFDDNEYNDDGEKIVLICNQDKVFRENDYVLVEFPGKKRQHRYVCVIQKLLSDIEIEVVALKKCEDTEFFRLNENDVSVIDVRQVVQKLTFPDMIISGDRLKYKFKEELTVDG